MAMALVFLPPYVLQTSAPTLPNIGTERGPISPSLSGFALQSETLPRSTLNRGPMLATGASLCWSVPQGEDV